MSDNWDDDDFEATVGTEQKTNATAKAEEETWDSSKWDKPAPKETDAKPHEQKPKPKPQPKQAKKEPEKPKELTTEEKSLLKKEAEQRSKISDFENTLDLFDGVERSGKKLTEDQSEILVHLEPKTMQDFSKLAHAIATRVGKYSEFETYPLFFKELCKLLTENINSSDVADVVKTLNIIVNDKLKVEKAPKKGMKKTAAKKKVVTKEKGDDDEEEYEGDGAAGGGDYDDFM